MGIFFKRNSKKEFENTPNDTNLNISPLSLEDQVDPSISNKPMISYNSDNIFVIATSEDGALQLFRELRPSGQTFKLFFKNGRSNILLMKEYPHTSSQSLDVFNHAMSQSGFAVTISTYFPNNPHMVLDFYLYDNSGMELFHKHYTEQGARCYKFSPSGRYFILMDYTSFYIYDMMQKNLSSFSPKDFGSSDSTDFIIFEDRQHIAYCYTQHPDTPFYHFTFSGRLLEEGAFHAQVEKQWELSAEKKRYYNLLEEIQQAKKPLSSDMYEQYISELRSFADNPAYQNSAALYRRMGEVELDAYHKEIALEYFEKALSLDSQIGVKRIASKIKKELEKEQT